MDTKALIKYASHSLLKYDVVLTKEGKKALLDWVEKFSFEEVMLSMEIAFENYDDGTKEGAKNAYQMIPHICAARVREKKDHALYWKNYLKKSVRTNFDDVDELSLKLLIDGVIRSRDDFEYAKLILKMSVSYEDFVENCMDRMGWGNEC